MKDTPLISVIIGSYNHEQYIAQSIESILAQSFTNFELIIIDDASSDKSPSIINSFANNSKITTLLHTDNKGISATYNEGFTIAKGKYIALLSGDDIALPQRLEKQFLYMEEHPTCTSVFSHAMAINDFGKEDSGITNFFKQPSRSREDFIKLFFIQGNILNASSQMMRTSILKKIGLYKLSQFQLQDFDQHIRFLINGDIHILQEILVQYRIRNDNKNVSNTSPLVSKRMGFEIFSLMDNFLLLSCEDIINSFGKKVLRYGNILPELTPYFLARLAMENHYAQKKLWGVQLLYSFLNSLENMCLVEKHCGFTYTKFLQSIERIQL
ncbi:MAG: glycosyltransferase family 2 protein [Desulfovibrionaceae bacterium]